MRNVGGLVLIGVVALASADCSSDGASAATGTGAGASSGSGGSGGAASAGTGAGSTGSGAGFDCAASCASLLALGCPNDDEADCLADCAESQSTLASCQPGVLAECSAQHLACDAKTGKAGVAGTAFYDECGSLFAGFAACVTCLDTTPGLTACDRCTATKCCDEATAFFQDPSYVAALKCFEGCKGKGMECFAACGESYSGALDQAAAVDPCRQAKCKAECGG